MATQEQNGIQLAPQPEPKVRDRVAVENDIARLEAERDKSADRHQIAERAHAQLEDERRHFIEQEVEGADRSLALDNNTLELVTAERELKDAAIRTTAVDRKLTELRTELEIVERAERQAARRAAEEAARAKREKAAATLARAATELQEYAQAELDAYSLRNTVGASVGRTPRWLVTELILSQLRGVPSDLDRPHRDDAEGSLRAV